MPGLCRQCSGVYEVHSSKLMGFLKSVFFFTRSISISPNQLFRLMGYTKLALGQIRFQSFHKAVWWNSRDDEHIKNNVDATLLGYMRCLDCVV